LAIASSSTKTGHWKPSTLFFDRKKILPLLRGYGRFSRADLEALIWWDRTTDEPKYTPAEQKVFLGMMESCGICFRVRELPHASQGTE
jgi:hypothetical protein